MIRYVLTAGALAVLTTATPVHAFGSGQQAGTGLSHGLRLPETTPDAIPVSGTEEHSHDMSSGMGPWSLGDLTIAGAFSRATLPNAPVGGGFLTVTNAGSEDDTLVAASTAVAGRTEIHEMAMEGEVMKMRALTDGLPIPAGATVELKPGGFHLMFMELTGSLVEGETFTVTLTFEKAGEIEVPISIAGPGAKGMDHSGHSGHSATD